jgi:hypothetical protein
MSEQERQQSSQTEAEEHADAKPAEEREHEQEWSQGGQDVEEAQHEEPDPGE